MFDDVVKHIVDNVTDDVVIVSHQLHYHDVPFKFIQVEVPFEKAGFINDLKKLYSVQITEIKYAGSDMIQVMFRVDE